MCILLAAIGLGLGILLGWTWGRTGATPRSDSGAVSPRGLGPRETEPNAYGPIAHELRTPLAALSSSIEVQERVLARLDTNPESLEFRSSAQALATARSALGQIEDLVEGLQTAGKTRSEQVQPTPVRAIVDAALLLVGHRLAGVDLERDDSPGVHIRVVPGDLVRVLVNLLVNAARALPDGGQVRIRTREHEEWAEIEVADSGPGIPREDEDRIFEEGFTRWASGTMGEGYGLSLCRDTTRRHGGDLVLTESDLGGAAFLVRLPALRQNLESETAG